MHQVFKYNKIIWLISFLWLSIVGSAQTPLSVDWANSFGGQITDNISKIINDDDGNIYLIGRFEDTVDFDPGPAVVNLISKGASDAFIKKIDSTGQFLWVRSFGGPSFDDALSIDIDQNGAVYITGTFLDTVSLSSFSSSDTLISKGKRDVFLLKVNSNGNLIWSKSYGGPEQDYGYALALDGSTILLTGTFEASVDFDPNAGLSNLSSNGRSDVFIQKLDTAGQLIWVESVGGPRVEIVYDLEVDLVGNVYVTGVFFDNVDFDPGSGSDVRSSIGNRDNFVLSLNSVGSYRWAKTDGGISSDFATALTIDNSGFIYAGGIFQNSVNFNNSPTTAYTSNGGYDAYIQKLDSSGNFIWVKVIGGVGSEFLSDLEANSSNDIFSTGNFFGTVDFDPNQGVYDLTSSGASDIFLQRMDSLGQLKYAVSMGGFFTDGGNDLFLKNEEQVILSGSFQGTIDLDPTPLNKLYSSKGVQDIFIEKLLPCEIKFAIDSVEACDSLTWINGITYFSNNTGDRDTIVSSNGCDSIVQLYLTINSSAFQVDTVETCYAYTWIDGLTYLKSTNAPTFTFVGGTTEGCDSTVNLNLTILRADTGIDKRTSCNLFTWIDGNTYASSNNTAFYTIPNGAVNGCDSSVFLDLTILPIDTGIDVVTACEQYTWIDGNTYASSNNTALYKIKNGAANGCDSVVRLNLTLLKNQFGVDTIVACKPITWLDGQTYANANNTAMFIISNGASNGCDSIVRLNLSFFTPFGIDTIISCAPIVWIDGNTYSTSNYTASFVLANASSEGCDSLVQLNFTRQNPASSIDTITACDSIRWIDGILYTSSNNTASYTITNGATNGCDSIVYLDLRIINKTSFVETVEACSSFIWKNGIEYFQSTNTPEISFTSSKGCDSTVALNLTITQIEKEVEVSAFLLTYSGNADSLQWLNCANNFEKIPGQKSRNFVADSNGLYAVEVYLNQCRDTSNCALVSVVKTLEDRFETVKISPNPTSSDFKIEFEELTGVKLRLLDYKGDLVFSSSNPIQSPYIYTPYIASGIYFIELSSEGKKRYYKVIKI